MMIEQDPAITKLILDLSSAVRELEDVVDLLLDYLDLEVITKEAVPEKKALARRK